VPDTPADDLQRLLFTADDEPSVAPEPTSGPAPVLRPGLEIDHYRLEGLLGKGAMGVVYAARDQQSGRRVALKLAGPEAAGGSRHAERARREGVAAAALKHPGIVRVHAAGTFQKRPYLVFELVEGARHLVEAAEGRPLAERVKLVREAASALGHAHANGVVHRDVKSENVLVDAAGRVRVADFGLAAMASADGRLTRSGALVGTPVCMAPEQVDGSGTVGPPTDVWALGVILYELLTGERPFEADALVQLVARVLQSDPERPSALDGSIPRALDRVVARALAKDPAERYPDGAALARALDEALAAPGSGLSSARSVFGLAVAAVLLAVGALAAWGSRAEPGAAATPSPQASVAADPLEVARQALAAAAQGRPDEAAVAATEEALWALARAGEPADPERFVALDDGPARLRVRTLALLLAGAPERAQEELSEAKGRLAVQLGQLVGAALEADRVAIRETRRGWGSELPSEDPEDPELPRVELALRQVRDAVAAAEQLPEGPELEGVRRWALPVCQDGVARLVVIARDLNADVRRLGARWLQRSLALAPRSEAAPRLRVAYAWCRYTLSDSWAREREDVQRELAQLGAVTPASFAFLKACVLADPGETPAQLAAHEEALAIARGDVVLGRRYARATSALRVSYAHGLAQQAWRLLAGGGSDSQGALEAAYRAAWAATVPGEGGVPQLGELAAQLSAHAPPAGAAPVGSLKGTRLLVMVLLMMREPEATRAALERLRVTERRLRALVEAELLWLEAGREAARDALEATCLDAGVASSPAWLALAHARSLDDDEEGAAAAVEAARSSEGVLLEVPWRTREHLDDLRAGHGWWPGRPE
jgi:serine/threonine-protein kinase